MRARRTPSQLSQKDIAIKKCNNNKQGETANSYEQDDSGNERVNTSNHNGSTVKQTDEMSGENTITLLSPKQVVLRNSQNISDNEKNYKTYKK